MIEIRWHGRGGQGAVTAAEIIATAVINEGKYAQAFAAFGPERRGAPVLAFTRISDNEIRLRTQINKPDIIVVLDHNLCTMPGIEEGLKPNGTVVLNTGSDPGNYQDLFMNAGQIVTVDATEIALIELGTPITNTSILGALIRATNLVKMETLEEIFREKFKGYADKNISAVKRAYGETKILHKELK